jgi:hypothetical protein
LGLATPTPVLFAIFNVPHPRADIIKVFFGGGGLLVVVGKTHKTFKAPDHKNTFFPNEENVFKKFAQIPTSTLIRESSCL